MIMDALIIIKLNFNIFFIFIILCRVEKSLSEKVNFEKNVLTNKDIFFAVKTSKHTQAKRLPTLIATWFQLAKKHTWFFTDCNNEHFQKITNNHLVVTNCNSNQSLRRYQCCRTEAEFTFYFNSYQKWFCHVDDYNYVNVPRLVEELKKFDHNKYWLLTGHKMQYEDKLHRSVKDFTFGVVGAGFCMSRMLAMVLKSHIREGSFQATCRNLNSSYDRTLNFMLERTGVTPTHLKQMHGPKENLAKIRNFEDQITLSYSGSNVIKIKKFNVKDDPTRFLSLHCHLFPKTNYCRQMKMNQLRSAYLNQKPKTMIQRIMKYLAT